MSTSASKQIELTRISENDLLAPYNAAISANSIKLCIIARDGEHSCDFIFAYGAPLEQIRGANSEVFKSIKDDAQERFNSPHIHNINNEHHYNVIAKIVRREEYTLSKKFAFIPVIFDGTRFVALAFSAHGDSISIDAVVSYIETVLSHVYLLLSHNELLSHVSTLERYVKEVGHDISSSVQAVIAKLSNIAGGEYGQELASIKAKEAKNDILSIYRVAENLGFVIDPDYILQNPKYFDFVKSIERVKEQLLSEATERNIELTLKVYDSPGDVYGDMKAIEVAVSHLLINAIKYSFGSSIVTISIKSSRMTVELLVTDRGLTVSSSEPVWDFGYRGTNALGHHANGSGIGLFTVKKVVLAHAGNVILKRSHEDERVVSFGFSMPIRGEVAKSGLTTKKSTTT